MSTPSFDDLPVPDEMTTLRARADLMGLTYHPSIGLEKLKEKLSGAMGEEVVESPKAPNVVVESEGALRMRLRKEANALVRIVVTCMNPAKKEWDGEMFTSGNSVVGTFTKYVPFNIEDGWHIPEIIYQQIIHRQCQIFYTQKDSKGDDVRKGKLIKEFNILVLPPLTTEEMYELAQRQAMAKSVD